MPEPTDPTTGKTYDQYIEELKEVLDDGVAPGTRSPFTGISSSPRMAGKSNYGRSFGPTVRHSMHADELDRAIRRAHANSGGLALVVWRSKHVFTYAGVGVGFETGNPRWFITGKGDFYSGNEFTHAQFIDQVLMHDEVTDILVGLKFDLLYRR